MSEFDYMDKSEKLTNLTSYKRGDSSVALLSQNSASPENSRKLAFFKLLEASKKHYLQKIQGKDDEALEKTRQQASKLYSDYNRAKNLTTVK